MKKLLILFAFPIIFVCSSCCNAKDYECLSNDPNRVGAYCNDGTVSDNTRILICFTHGGVRAYRCNKCGD